MAVVPGWHNRGALPTRRSGLDSVFAQEIEPAALPTDVEDIKVEYLIKAGQAAIHDVMIPHNSPPNRCRTLAAGAGSALRRGGHRVRPEVYRHYRTAEPFNRAYFLVRGRDIAVGFRRGLDRGTSPPAALGWRPAPCPPRCRQPCWQTVHNLSDGAGIEAGGTQQGPRPGSADPTFTASACLMAFVNYVHYVREQWFFIFPSPALQSQREIPQATANHMNIIHVPYLRQVMDVKYTLKLFIYSNQWSCVACQSGKRQWYC